MPLRTLLATTTLISSSVFGHVFLLSPTGGEVLEVGLQPMKFHGELQFHMTLSIGICITQQAAKKALGFQSLSIFQLVIVPKTVSTHMIGRCQTR